MTRVLAGLFDSRGDAERTVERLIQEFHVAPDAVEMHGAGAEDNAAPDAAPGFLRRLATLITRKQDVEAFREGVRRNGVVVVARVSESVADRAMDTFEENGAVDLDARLVDWRGAGWAPAHGGATGHDEDIGYSTYGSDAVLGHIPRHHHDNTPAGLLGRWEMAAMAGQPGRTRARVRSYLPAKK